MRKIKTATIAASFIIIITACGGGSQGTTDTQSGSPKKASSMLEPKEEASPKGIGEIKNVTLSDPLEESMLVNGKSIYEMKCSACHKLTDQRVVGPGWAGVTNRRRPEWIMNMITNTDIMLDKDPAARALLEECLTRMPNQGLSTGDARNVLEYMRKNDVEQVGEKDKAVNG